MQAPRAIASSVVAGQEKTVSSSLRGIEIGSQESASVASSSPIVTFIPGSPWEGSATAPVSVELGAERGKGGRLNLTLTPTADQLTHQHVQVLCDLCSHNTWEVLLCNTTASPPTHEAGSEKVALGLRNLSQQAPEGQSRGKSHTATESSLEPELTHPV